MTGRIIDLEAHINSADYLGSALRSATVARNAEQPDRAVKTIWAKGAQSTLAPA